MSYALDDFKYSIQGGYDRINPLKESIEKVLFAYGNVDTEGACCEECGGEWTGGFILLLKSGKFAYVTGWCDYTGWGCQDGASYTIHDSLTEIDIKPFWDKDPADLNNELPNILKALEDEEA